LPRSPAGEISRVSINEEKLSEKALAALEKYGAVIFEGTASSGELKEAEALFWDWVKNSPGKICKDDPQSFGDGNWNQICFPKNGVCSKFGVGQSKFMWYCRLISGVRRAFESVWGSNELITSFDGWGAYRNPWFPGGSKSWLTKRGWFHIDQSYYSDPELTTYQGILNFYEATAATGSTVLVKGSHKDFKKVFDGSRTIKSVRQNTVDYVKVTKSDDYDKYLSKAQQAVLKPGDFLMWDSRVIHCAQGIDYSAGVSKALPGRESEPLARLVAYITMIPREHITKRRKHKGAKKVPSKASIMKARRYYVENRLTSGHNPLLTKPLNCTRDSTMVPATDRKNEHKIPDEDDPLWDLV